MTDDQKELMCMLWLRGEGWLAVNRNPIVFERIETARALIDRFYTPDMAMIIPVGDIKDRSMADLQDILLERDRQIEADRARSWLWRFRRWATLTH